MKFPDDPNNPYDDDDDETEEYKKFYNEPTYHSSTKYKRKHPIKSSFWEIVKDGFIRAVVGSFG